MTTLKKTDVYVVWYVFIAKGPREQGFPISKVRPHDIDIAPIFVNNMLSIRRPIRADDKTLYFSFYLTAFNMSNT